MKGLPLYKKRKADGRCWLMAHASTEEALRLWKRKERFIWDSSMVDRKRGIPGYVSIVAMSRLLLYGAIRGSLPRYGEARTEGSSMWTAERRSRNMAGGWAACVWTRTRNFMFEKFEKGWKIRE